MSIAESVIQDIANRLSLVDIVGSYLALQKRGGRYWGLCPFHSEKTPSFTIFPDETGFYCFGCQKGGSLFTFIQEIEHLNFPEAVELLAEKAGVQVQTDSGDPAAAKKKTKAVDTTGGARIICCNISSVS